MTDDVSFEVVTDADVPARADIKEEQMHEGIVNSVDRAELRKQEMKDRGMTGPAAAGADIPADLPKMMFKIGSKVISCEKFSLDDDEARTFAKHLTILTGGVNSKIFSAIIVIVIIAGKCIECMDAIRRKFSGDVPDKLKPEDKPDKNLPELLS